MSGTFFFSNIESTVAKWLCQIDHFGVECRIIVSAYMCTSLFLLNGSVCMRPWHTRVAKLMQHVLRIRQLIGDLLVRH